MASSVGHQLGSATVSVFSCFGIFSSCHRSKAVLERVTDNVGEKAYKLRHRRASTAPLERSKVAELKPAQSPAHHPPVAVTSGARRPSFMTNYHSRSASFSLPVESPLGRRSLPPLRAGAGSLTPQSSGRSSPAVSTSSNQPGRAHPLSQSAPWRSLGSRRPENQPSAPFRLRVEASDAGSSVTERTDEEECGKDYEGLDRASRRERRRKRREKRKLRNKVVPTPTGSDQESDEDDKPDDEVTSPSWSHSASDRSGLRKHHRHRRYRSFQGQQESEDHDSTEIEIDPEPPRFTPQREDYSASLKSLPRPTFHEVEVQKETDDIQMAALSTVSHLDTFSETRRTKNHTVPVATGPTTSQLYYGSVKGGLQDFEVAQMNAIMEQSLQQGDADRV